MRRLPDAPPGGKAITVDLEGEALPAREGEPVAVALLAAGETVLSRSAKYHRPRGASCLSGACSHCLMRVNGVPNVHTCQTPARAGMRLERQNAYPSAEVDVFEGLDWVFPKGMDHHAMFAGVPVAEQVMARVARQLAGLGTLPESAAPARPPALEERTRVVVVGGGAAGLSAAAVLATRGVPFLLLEREGTLGGRLTRGAPEGAQPALPALPDGSVRTHALAIGLYEDAGGRFVAAVQYGPGGPRLHKLYAERFVLALGGHPQVLPFENNDLPGVYAGRAAAALLRVHDIAPERAALVGWGPELYALARLYAERGIEVVALVDVRGPLPDGAPPQARLGGELAAHGLRKVRALSFSGADGQREKVACDAVVVAIPPQPAFELPRQGGARVEFDEAREAFVVVADADGRTGAPGVFAAGDVTGVLTAAEAWEQGRRAGEALVGGLS